MSHRDRRKYWNKYLSTIRRNHVRAAGDHRRWMPALHACAECGRRYVRLYRLYGGFLCEHEIVCNAHLPENPEWHVPLISAADGSVWGYTSCPDADIARWRALPEADPGGRSWDRGKWTAR